MLANNLRAYLERHARVLLSVLNRSLFNNAEGVDCVRAGSAAFAAKSHFYSKLPPPRSNPTEWCTWLQPPTGLSRASSAAFDYFPASSCCSAGTFQQTSGTLSQLALTVPALRSALASAQKTLLIMRA